MGTSVAVQTLGDGGYTEHLDADDGFAGQITLEVYGTFVGTMTFQARIAGGTNVYTVTATRLADNTAVTTVSNANPGMYRVNATGIEVRLLMTAWTSGAASVIVKPLIG